jgi:hypothetical protein
LQRDGTLGLWLFRPIIFELAAVLALPGIPNVLVAVYQTREVTATANLALHESQAAIEETHDILRHVTSVGFQEALRCQLPDKVSRARSLHERGWKDRLGWGV